MPNRNIEGNYRYKFQGQEKDAETGKEAFELRLWDGRIGRWLTVDPAGQYSSPYLGMGNNPINGVDPDGGEWFDWVRGKDGDTWVWREDITSKGQATAAGLQYGGATKSDVIKNWGFNTTDGFEGLWNRNLGDGHGQKFDWNSYVSGRIPVAIEQGLQSQINKNQELRDNPYGDISLAFSKIDLGIDQLPNSFGNIRFQSGFNFNGENVLFNGKLSTLLSKNNRFFNFMKSYEIYSSSGGDIFENAIFFDRGLTDSAGRIPTLIIEVHSDKHFSSLHSIMK